MPLPRSQIKPVGVPVAVCVNCSVAGLHNKPPVELYIKSAVCDLLCENVSSNNKTPIHFLTTGLDCAGKCCVKVGFRNMVLEQMPGI